MLVSVTRWAGNFGPFVCADGDSGSFELGLRESSYKADSLYGKLEEDPPLFIALGIQYHRLAKPSKRIFPFIHI